MKRTLLSALVLLLLAQPARAAWVVRSHSIGQTSTCTGGTTVSLTLDTSSATLVVAVTVANDATTAPGGTDTWTQAISATNVVGTGLYYVKAPTQTASYSVTLSDTNRCVGLAAAAFDPSDTVAPLDGTSKPAAFCGTTTCQAAAAVGASGDLVVSGLTVDWTGTASIGSSFTILDQLPFLSGQAYGVALAWKETTGTENPQWSGYSASQGASDSVLGAFKAGAGGGGGSTSHPCGSLHLLGVGCEAHP